MEDELIIIVYSVKNALTEKIATSTRYLSVVSPEGGNAIGLFKCIGEALENDWYKQFEWGVCPWSGRK